jgi:DNA-binding transcriptional MocR family regulator
MRTGRLEDIILAKRSVANQIQEEIKPLLTGLSYQTFPTSFHLWLRLPDDADSCVLVRELLSRQFAITGGKDFSPTDSHDGNNFVRVAFGAESKIEKIEAAVKEIITLL